MNFLGGWKRHLRLTVISAVLVLVTVGCWILAVQLSRTLVHASFEDRSVAYVQAFASSAVPWIQPLQPTMLRSAAQFMLVGSAQYVQVVVAGSIVVDERSEGRLDWSLPLLDPMTGSDGFARPSHGSEHVLDIATPLGSVEGYVRMGIDTSSARVQVSRIALWAGALAIGADLLLLGLLWWLFGFRATLRRQDLGTAATRTAGNVRIGELCIDADQKRVTYRGEAVRLTPKQYTLIEFFGRSPDQVFSDQEIVAEVWQDSLYADSKDVKQYVYLLRQRLGAIHPNGKRMIETVPGFGYKLVSQLVDQELTD